MRHTVLLAEMTWQDAKRAVAEGRVVIIPFGSIEQHGHHLPLATDSINLTNTATLAAREAGALLAPTQVFGVSHNHLDFAGTMSLEPETLIAVIQDLVASLYHHGFRRILLLNGHGGNNATIDVAAIKARKRFPDAVIGHSYSAALARDARPLWTSGFVYHADEGETARLMAIRPELVEMANAVRDVTPTFDRYYHRYYDPGANRDSLTGLVTYGLPQTQVLARSGTMGDASVADPELGKQAIALTVNNLVRVLHDLKEREILVADPNDRP
ncbi:MAG: creatininase family protein [Thermomicrobiales bacterium]